MYYAVAWVVLLIAFGVLEAMTASLVSIWFCVGAAVALIAAVMGAGLGLQIGLFALVSILSMVLIRPFAKKVLRPANEKTNADQIIGQEALVTEPICNVEARGQIRIRGMEWTARSVDETEIPVGKKVSILRIEGVKVIVQVVESERV